MSTPSHEHLELTGTIKTLPAIVDLEVAHATVPANWHPGLLVQATVPATGRQLLVSCASSLSGIKFNEAQTQPLA